MRYYTIVTDSSCDLPAPLLEKMGIRVVPLAVNLDGKTYFNYPDGRAIGFEEYYAQLRSGKQATTSAVNMSLFRTVMEAELIAGHDVLYLGFSSGLSGTYSAALVAREMLGRKDIYVVDNKATALALALMVQIACEKRDAGLSAREVAEQVEALSGRVRVYALVETLRYLVLGGRLSKAAGLVGSALNLKPIITLKGGVLSAVGKARGTRAAVKLLRELVDANERIDTNYPVYYGHAFNDEGIALLQQAFPEYPTKAPVLTVGCIVGTHTGPKVTAISFISEVEA